MKTVFLFRRFSALVLAFCTCVFLFAAAEEIDPSLLIVDDSIADQCRVEDMIDMMTLHEKVCQLFFIQPEQFSQIDRVTAYSKKLGNAVHRFPVGGIILFAANITRKDISSLNAGLQQAALDAGGIGLFIGVDEEGGGVSRVANSLKLSDKQPAPGRIGSPDQAYESGRVIGGYLSEYGFNLDFAPVADVRSDIGNAEITVRSYGRDPEFVARMVVRFMEGLRTNGVISVLKHFPGHGAVSGNTHSGSGTSQKTLEEWRVTDFVPFTAGIEAGADIVMVSHQLAVAVDPDCPASLSSKGISLLRNELGFEGVVITDALRMDAVHDSYGTAEACVLALEAGADMLLLPYNFTNAYEGVMQAVKDGRLTEERIDESLLRILSLKERCNLLPSIPK